MLNKEKKHPGFVKPELARLAKKAFSDKDWIYETKFDGIRCIAVKKDKKITLYSRNKNKLNANYPDLVTAITKQRQNNFVIDGEIVAFEKGVTSFSKLQQIKKEKIAVYFYVFDLIYFDQYSTKNLPLLERKKLLKKYFQFSTKFRYTSHMKKEGEKFYKKACKKGLEGVMAKKADSKYLSKRTSEWQKFKCSERQELIIIGYTKPEGQRIGFGALLIGYFENGKLKFAGKVGTGYDFEFLKNFSNKLKAIETEKNYFRKIKNAKFVRLKYVAEIAFTQWTKDGKLRHPRFIGLRSDKSPKSVVKEKAR